MADMASEAFRLADAEGRFLYVNDRSGSLSGYTRDEMLQMTIFDLNPTMKRETWHAWKDAVGDRLGPFETSNRRRDGTLIPVEVSIARIASGTTSYFFAVVRDITDRKETEAAQHGFNRRLLHTLEAERHRVARELDDEVGQAVATVGVLLHTLENAPGVVPADLRPSLAAAHTTVRQITESIARIARDYRPTDLLSLGLEATIRTHVHEFAQRHGLSLRLATSDVEGLLADEHALHLYRIVQEALSNVARHARAQHVTVRLGRRGSRLVATIRDDGIGFDDGHPGPGGLGLVTMRERAALIAGRLDLRSRPGRGTTVQLSIPVTRSPSA
jgi:PAS domain S-box-containing protein